MKWENDIFAQILRMRQMVYNSKDFESLCFLYQAEGLPKNISIKEFCTKHGVDYPTFDKWYRKTHKKVYPITVTGMPADEEAEIQAEAEKGGRRARCMILSGIPSNVPQTGWPTSTRRSPLASSSMTE